METRENIFAIVQGIDHNNAPAQKMPKTITCWDCWAPMDERTNSNRQISKRRIYNTPKNNLGK
jgi:hypothetical protein